jgi:general secretion pathway protein F
MPAFEYEGLDAEGRNRRGTLGAESLTAARRDLLARGLTLTRLRAAAQEDRSASKTGGRIKPAPLALITRQLAVLIRTGSPVEEAVGVLASETETRAAKAVLVRVRARIVEGRRLSEALLEEPASFPPLYCSVVAAGESVGALAPVLERLAAHLERREAVRRKVQAAMIYPIVLTCVALLVIGAMLGMVVPRVVEQFDTMDRTLPALTRGLVAISGGVRDFGLPVLVCIILAGIAGAQALKQPAARLMLDRALLRVPIIGRLIRDVDGAQFARTMATLVGSGATVLGAIRSAQATLSNHALRGHLGQIGDKVRDGAALSGGLKQAGVFPPMLAHMAASGERSGDLASLFDTAASFLESEFQARTDVALALLEPLIILIMGLAVVLIVLAIMLPILQLNTLSVF